MIEINIKKMNDDAIIPTKGSEYSAGYDLYANLLQGNQYNAGHIVIPEHKTVKIGTGISIELPKGYFGAIFARSGLATKEGLRPANCVGVCDSDYRGEYIVAMHNDTNYPKVINHGDRIAQLVIIPFLQVQFVETKELSETERGEKGFGSTGIN